MIQISKLMAIIVLRLGAEENTKRQVNDMTNWTMFVMNPSISHQAVMKQTVCFYFHFLN